jgi:glycosyltransferase involved in cell wall biosynthesis
MALVSVIIPTHNREDFITECVESVLKQTFQDFELIVVDDGSNDSAVEKLKPYFSKLIYLKQANKGPSSARNTGIRVSNGTWICFLDSDDLWRPKKLEKQIEYFQSNSEAKICYTEEIWYRKGRRVNPAKKHQKYSGWIYEKMLPLCIISPSSVMIHRSIFDAIGLFDESLLACEDYDLWLRIGAKYPIHLLSDPLIIKRNGHEGQQSQKFWGMDRFRVKALKKMLDAGNLPEKQQKATQSFFETKCSILASGCEKRGKKEEAIFYKNLFDSYK